ncbi:hypothetical protein L228DRAFT_280431 [Xylona heveae TC161]|uniref:Uncharacterized protein n=1 Tax=Xylona heveae (strain CBS 132557 / TC161) TaxID=1328760 RepID=A0A165IP10_XYLHT|nr:hypothetical protein L228DRAFT_280431 [Xylona heveae TC161]KZF25175.1 hypothetical protein L228DRAFT_280431 [Xylona heveae TC161]
MSSSAYDHSSPSSIRSPKSTDETALLNGESFHWEPFRAGAPGPLPWLPVRILPIVKGDQRIINGWELVRPLIGPVLRDWKIDYRSFTILRRRPYENATFQHKFESDITLVVSAKFQFDDSWKNAISEIRAILRSNDLAEVVVEFIDPCTAPSKNFLPIMEDDPIVSVWEGMRLDVRKALETCPWTSINVVRKEKMDVSEDKYPVTIVVIVPVDDHRLFVEEYEKLKAICRRYGFRDMEVQILHGPGPLWPGRTVEPILSSDAFVNRLASALEIPRPDTYSRRVAMGVSMGPRGSADIRNGSFGGYVELIDPKSGKSHGIFGLTCYHVIEPAIPKERQAVYAEQGIDPSDSLGRSLVLEQPGFKDHSKYMQTYKDDDVEKERMKVFWDNHKTLGTVFCGSGLRRKLGDHIMNWALVAAEKDRIGDNSLPSGPDNWAFESTEHLEARSIFAGKCLSTVGKLLDEEFVFKKGKASGCQVGLRTAIKSEVRIPGDRESTEHAFVGLARSAFGEDGDAGSMVFSKSGQWLGLFWGGDPYGSLSGTSFVTDSRCIIEDIERVTGCQVRLPR